MTAWNKMKKCREIYHSGDELEEDGPQAEAHLMAAMQTAQAHTDDHEAYETAEGESTSRQPRTPKKHRRRKRRRVGDARWKAIDEGRPDPPPSPPPPHIRPPTPTLTHAHLHPPFLLGLLAITPPNIADANTAVNRSASSLPDSPGGGQRG